MILLLLLLAGDFTYTAPDGYWLDYARTGRLSEDRYLVVQHLGEKGEYHLGGRQMVFDSAGVFLYDIPNAGNAWFVCNLFLGDPDTFIFQTKTNISWVAWNIVYGSRLVTADESMESTDELVKLHNSTNFKLFKMAKDGHRLVFMSKVPKQTDTGLSMKTRFEVLDFDCSPEAFFTEPYSKPDLYSNLLIDKDFNYAIDDSKLALYDIIAGMHGLAAFFEINLEGDGNKLPFIEHKTSLSVEGMAWEKGYVAYRTRGAMVVEKLDADTPLFVLRDAAKGKAGYAPLLDFAASVGRGAISEHDGHLSYVKDGVLVDFDTRTNTLQHFFLENATKRISGSENLLEVNCDARTFSVKTLKQSALLGKKASILSISADSFK